MIERAIKFKKKLDKVHKKSVLSGKSNFVFLGDFNTMGMNLTYSKKDVSAEEEIRWLGKRLSSKYVGMKILAKSIEETYWPGSKSKYPIGNPDHIIATDHLELKQFNGASVSVRGWVEDDNPSKKDQWTEKFPDHSLLYFEVQEIWL